MPHLWYQNNEVPDYETLLAHPFDLASPFRSTAMLLAYWRHYEHRLPHFCGALGFNLAPPVEEHLRFEHQFSPPAGQGRASCTDLLIEVPGLAMAVEAKRTEPEYESVREWLREPPEPNRQAVLNGWLRTINNATAANLNMECVMNVTYQLIHRTASACSRNAQSYAVAYHCFNPTPPMLAEYQQQIATLATLLNNPARITFVLCNSSATLTPDYVQLQNDWNQQPHPDLNAAVRAVILNDGVAAFNDQIAFRF